MPYFECKVRRTFYKEVTVRVEAENDLDAGDEAESAAEEMFHNCDLQEGETEVLSADRVE